MSENGGDGESETGVVKKKQSRIARMLMYLMVGLDVGVKADNLMSA
jgi:hypothetical protein